MLHSLYRVASSLSLLALTTVTLSASIRVGPMAVYLSDKHRSGAVTISSVSPHTIDVRLDLYYGFIRSDERGNVEIFIDETDANNPRSCAAWIEMDPRRLTLLPGESRTVRFIARPPEGLGEGEYWSRLAVTSEERCESAATANDAVTTRQKMNLRTIIPISYRKGEVFADIKLMNTVIGRQEGTVHFNVDMQPMGNAAYLGNMKLLIHDVKGKEVFSTAVELAVFTMFRRRFDIPSSRMPAGRYKATIVFDTERPDLGADVLPVLPKTYTVEFILP
jgi:hypothetical protein